MANRKWQDWTNRNLFATSVESFADAVPPLSYQESSGIELQPEEAPVEVGQGRETSTKTKHETSSDPHAGGPNKSITSLQAAWNVTNAIQGQCIRDTIITRLIWVARANQKPLQECSLLACHLP